MYTGFAKGRRLQAESQRMSIASGDSNCNTKRRAHRDYILFKTLKVNGLYHSYVGYIYNILYSIQNSILIHIFGLFGKDTSLVISIGLHHIYILTSML